MGKKIQDEYSERSDLTNQQKWRLRNPEKYNKIKKNAHKRMWDSFNEEKRADYHLKKRYKISFEDYKSIFYSQNGKCAICDKEIKLLEKSYERAVVDHSHNSGEIRGLLCSACNKAIGIVKESTKTLANMIKYLEKNNK